MRSLVINIESHCRFLRFKSRTNEAYLYSGQNSTKGEGSAPFIIYSNPLVLVRWIYTSLIDSCDSSIQRVSLEIIVKEMELNLYTHTTVAICWIVLFLKRSQFKVCWHSYRGKIDTEFIRKTRTLRTNFDKTYAACCICMKISRVLSIMIYFNKRSRACRSSWLSRGCCKRKVLIAT